MNWRRGLFRLASVSWLAYLFVLSPWMTAVSETECFEAAKKRSDGSNPFDCFHGTGMKFDHLSLPNDLIPYILSALAPVIAILLMGIAGCWISAGFQDRD
jgi:hypothetical protein